MPNWSNTPPPKTEGHGMRLRRTPGPGRLVATITSDDVLGCPTHFHHFRTIPCSAPDCDACREGYSWRWHGYVTAVDASTHEHFVYEFTATATETLTDYRKRHGTLRGCLFEATRIGQRHNGRVLIRCKPADLTTTDLPQPPNLKKLLCHIWSLPTTAADVDGLQKGHPRIHVDPPKPGNSKPRQPVTSPTQGHN